MNKQITNKVDEITSSFNNRKEAEFHLDMALKHMNKPESNITMVILEFRGLKTYRLITKYAFDHE